MGGESAAEVGKLRKLEQENAQLQGALQSRIVIEQAKGILCERLELEIDEAFAVLRYAARSARTSLRELAERVVSEPRTPTPVVVALARQARWRAASMKKRNGAARARMQMTRLETTLRPGNADRPLEQLATAELESRRSRAARNESLYRTVNEAIKQANRQLEADGVDVAEFICECARRDCATRLKMPIDEYEAIRADPTHFLVTPDHHEPGLEIVVRRGRNHWVVGKLGAGAAVAAMLDPRRPTI